MELQSQSNSTDTEIVQDELKHSAPIPSSTHSKGGYKCLHGGCGRKGCCKQVSEGASDAYAQACDIDKLFQDANRCKTDCTQTSLLMWIMRCCSSIGKNTGSQDMLLFLQRKRYWLSRHGQKNYLSVSFHRCHLASSVNFSVHLHLTRRTQV